MNFRTHVDGPVDTHMTSLQGYIQGTLAQMILAFGRPRAGCDGGFYEWHVKFADGQVATIYDWRRRVEPAPDEVISWNIGGHTRTVAEQVHESFRDGQPALAARRRA